MSEDAAVDHIVRHSNEASAPGALEQEQAVARHNLSAL